ncbi:MAG: hypothetical protein Fur003_3080 [Candidatus Dojkabacteria bacterium]
MDPKIKAKIAASTQDHLEVEEVIDDLVITKGGNVGLVLQTNAVNFDLLSEYEQDGKILAFAGLLNSLNFQIQIMIKTQQIDIANYLNYLKKETNRDMSPGLKKQLQIYTHFIQNIIVTNDVLDKKFYIVVPYNPGVKISGARVKKDNKAAAELISQNMEKTLDQAKIFLLPKRDHILKQLGRMGLIGHQLTNDELIALFYSIYNPES